MRILRNNFIRSLSFLYIGNILKYIINFFILSYTSKILLPEGIGKIAFASSFFPYFITIINFGFVSVAIREIAKNNTITTKYINNIITLRTILAVFSYTVLFSLTLYLNNSKIIKKLILIYGLNIFINIFEFQFCFQALEKIPLIIYFELILFSIKLILVFIFVKDTSDYFTLGIINVLIMGLTILTFLGLYLHHFKYLKFEFDKKFIKNLLKDSWQIGLSLIFISILQNLDVSILGSLESDKTVGYYKGAIYLITYIDAFIRLLNYTLLPRLSKSYKREHQNIDKSMFILNRISIIICFSIILGAEMIILLVYGVEFNLTIEILQLLIFSIFFLINRIIFVNLLLAANLTKENLISVSISAIINIIILVITIPILGIYGAVIGRILTEFFLFLFYVYYSKKEIRVNFKENFLFSLIILPIWLISLIFFQRNYLLIVLIPTFTLFLFFSFKKNSKGFFIVKEFYSNLVNNKD